MSRNFLPKSMGLSDEMFAKLVKKFKFSEKDIMDIKYWNDPHSPYRGVIINTEPNSQYPCYPYDRGGNDFMEEYDARDDGVKNLVLTEKDLE